MQIFYKSLNMNIAIIFPNTNKIIHIFLNKTLFFVNNKIIKPYKFFKFDILSQGGFIYVR